MIREINEREVWVDDRLRFLHLATSPRDLVATDTLKKKLARLEAEVCSSCTVNLLLDFIALSLCPVSSSVLGSF